MAMAHVGAGPCWPGGGLLPAVSRFPLALTTPGRGGPRATSGPNMSVPSLAPYALPVFTGNAS